jgi:hypothetical protein
MESVVKTMAMAMLRHEFLAGEDRQRLESAIGECKPIRILLTINPPPAPPSGNCEKISYAHCAITAHDGWWLQWEKAPESATTEQPDVAEAIMDLRVAFCALTLDDRTIEDTQKATQAVRSALKRLGYRHMQWAELRVNPTLEQLVGVLKRNYSVGTTEDALRAVLAELGISL